MGPDELNDVVEAARSRIWDQLATRPDGSVIPKVPATRSDAEVADEFARGLSPALPGFRRTGRTWRRSDGRVTAGIHVYRLRAANDVCCWVRLEPFVGLANGLVNFSGMGPSWRIFNGGADVVPDSGFATAEHLSDGEETGLEVAIRQARDSIDSGMRQWLDEMSSPTIFLQNVPTDARQWRLNTLLAFDMLQELETELVLGPPGWVDGVLSREVNLAAADAAARSYSALGAVASPEWRSFAERAVRSFRGRPPKKLRASYDSVKAALESW